MTTRTSSHKIGDNICSIVLYLFYCIFMYNRIYQNLTLLLIMFCSDSIRINIYFDET